MVGFGTIFEFGNHLGQARRLRRLAEFGDVGAGDEGAAGAGQHDRLHFRIGGGSFDGFKNAAANRRAERVHRRTVDRDNGDHVMTFELDHFTHDTLLAHLVFD